MSIIKLYFLNMIRTQRIKISPKIKTIVLFFVKNVFELEMFNVVMHLM